jgi:hypothetical protein
MANYGSEKRVGGKELMSKLKVKSILTFIWFSCLLNNVVSCLDNTASTDQMASNWKNWKDMKENGHSLFQSSNLEVSKRTDENNENFVQNSWFPAWNSNWVPPWIEVKNITIWTSLVGYRHSATKETVHYKPIVLHLIVNKALYFILLECL